MVLAGGTQRIGFDAESLGRVDCFANAGEGDFEYVDHDLVSLNVYLGGSDFLATKNPCFATGVLTFSSLLLV